MHSRLSNFNKRAKLGIKKKPRWIKATKKVAKSSEQIRFLSLTIPHERSASLSKIDKKNNKSINNVRFI